jgi:Na+-transporting NADH:ubiquinone oxidoreductase subunit B
MKFLRNLLDKQEKLFHKGGKLEKLFPLFEAGDTFVFTPGKVTEGPSHLRDGLDLKRMMMTVVIALAGCIYMAMYNTGYQALLAMAQGAVPIDSWQAWLYEAVGFSYDFKNPIYCIIFGALHYLPVVVAAMATGGIVEPLVAMIRKHEINEGFLVTGMLIPLTLPPTIPLWMVVVGTAFGIIFAKEIFGGTGMNFLNPALTARAFLFFAYPAEMSGNVWVPVDGYTGATPLALAAEGGMEAVTSGGVTWAAAFIGTIPGSMGETSALGCLIGAVMLIYMRIASWKIMLGVVLGLVAMTSLFNLVGSDTNPMFAIPWHWHLVLGSVAFGLVFMATDPVSASMTETGKWIYGALIGVMVALIRVVNPAYPEGVMLAILFGNVFAPVIDWFVVQANVRRRTRRNAQ